MQYRIPRQDWHGRPGRRYRWRVPVTVEVKMMVEALGIHRTLAVRPVRLLLNVTPGPDTAYIIGRSIQMGWRGGAAAAIGICCGCLVHVFAAAVGLSALLMASSAAFTVLKWVGAAYLLFTGLQMLLSRLESGCGDARLGGETSLSRGVLARRPDQRAQSQGGAVFPGVPAAIRGCGLQRTRRWPSWVLGLIFISTGTLWCLGIAAFAARAASRIRQVGRCDGLGQPRCSAGCSSISGSALRCWRGR